MTMRFVIFFMIPFFLISCLSVKDLPNDLTEKQMQQQAHSYLDKGDYRSALLIYEEILVRFGDNLPSRVAAEFEIAHIHVKRKNWRKAEEMLTRILSYYEEDAYGLPGEYRKLAMIDMKKIPAKHQKKEEQ